MSLKNHSLHILATGSRSLADNNISYGFVIYYGLEATANAPVVKITGDFFLVLRWSRYLGETVKVLPHQLWIQIFDCHNI